jgi:hypothetical protein
MQIDLSDNERLALKALCQSGGDFAFLSFKLVSKRSGLEIAEVRQAVRSLAAHGYAEYASGLWTDDGAPAGSGYAATEQGRAFHQALSA